MKKEMAADLRRVLQALRPVQDACFQICLVSDDVDEALSRVAHYVRFELGESILAASAIRQREVQLVHDFLESIVEFLSPYIIEGHLDDIRFAVEYLEEVGL